MASNQTYKEYRVLNLPTIGLVAGDRYYLNVGPKKYKTFIVSDSLVLTGEAGADFIEKDTMAELRAITPREIWAIQNGYYKGVKLNGYYAAGDTPAPVEYLPSQTSITDNSGSVVEIGTFKLEIKSQISSPLYFGCQYNRNYNSTVFWNRFLSDLSARGGGQILVEGVIKTDGFSLPKGVSLRGVNTGKSELFLLENSLKDSFIDCFLTSDVRIENLYINGNRSNQNKEIHLLHLRSNGAETNYTYNTYVVSNYFRFASGDAIRCEYPSWIFTVADNRIRDIDGYGIFNSATMLTGGSTDNGFFNNNIALCRKGGVYNTGSNNRFHGGKIIFSGWENSNSAGFYSSGARCLITSVEGQENYYHNFSFSGLRDSIITVLSDMSNVVRRPGNKLGVPTVPDAVGYNLRMSDCDNNIITLQSTSAISSGEDFTAYGLFINSSCSDNTLNIEQRATLFGPDLIGSGVVVNNIFLNKGLTSNTTVTGDADFTVLNQYSLILTATLTSDRLINLPDPTTYIRGKRIVINNRATTGNSFNWRITNFPIGTVQGTSNNFIIPKNSVTILENIANGAGQWRVVNITDGLDPATKENISNKSNTNDNWNSTTLYPTKNAVNVLVSTRRSPSSVFFINSNRTLTDSDIGLNGEIFARADSAVSNVNITLPLASSSVGVKVIVKRVGSASNAVLISGRSVSGVIDPIDGSTTSATISSVDSTLKLISDGTGWYTYI